MDNERKRRRGETRQELSEKSEVKRRNAMFLLAKNHAFIFLVLCMACY